MKLRYYLRGLGIGIVVTAILMGVATKDSGQMTDAEIKVRAAQLGMVEQKVLADIASDVKVVEENSQPLVSPTVPPEVIENSNNSENVQEGESLGQQTVVTQPDSETDTKQPEETVDVTQPDSEADAKQPEETADVTQPDSETDTRQPEETAVVTQPDSETDTKQPEETVDVTQPNVEVDVSQADGKAETSGNLQETVDVIRLTIHSGASSWTVSKDLEASGLVTDAKEFDKFLSQGGYDKSISVGEFSIQMGASYEEIAQIITKRH